MKLIIASHNKNKIAEIKEILSPYFSQILSLWDINLTEEIEETGQTFLDNALLKAKTIAKQTNCHVIADDSGLCVEALDNRPGVYSARFAGEECNDHKNNDYLLKLLKDVDNRKAFFVSVVVLYSPSDNSYIFGEGKIHGTILNEYRGNKGFGYDPLFYVEEINKTFAQCDMDEKNKISHRALALKDLITKLNESIA